LRRVLQRGEGIGSGREVNGLSGWLLGKGRPAVDLSHRDLARGEERPEQHRGCFCRGQDGLGFDPPLELLVKPLNRIGRPVHSGRASRIGCGRRRAPQARRLPPHASGDRRHSRHWRHDGQERPSGCSGLRATGDRRTAPDDLPERSKHRSDRGPVVARVVALSSPLTKCLFSRNDGPSACSRRSELARRCSRREP
jgi:hypothetical protein